MLVGYTRGREGQGNFGFRPKGNLRERSSHEKKKDSGGLSAVAGVLVALPTTAKA
jgi:hypothetical protein